MKPTFAPLRRITLILSLVLLAGCASGPRFHVKVLPEYDACFEREEGWTGGDAAYTVALSGNRILWVFGDTFIGKIRNNRRTETAIVHNTVAVQHGMECPFSRMEFYVRGASQGKPDAWLPPENGRGWMWIYAGVVTPTGLYLFMIQVERKPDPYFLGFTVIDSRLAHVSNPDISPDRWQVTQHRIPFSRFSDAGNLFFGSALLKDNGFVYIYGTDEEAINNRRQKYMVLARAPEDQLHDFTQWRFFTLEGWGPNFSEVKRLFAGVASEYSISFLPALKRYIVVYSENGISDHILARLAPNPWGPWGEPFTLYTCPEADKHTHIFCYAAKGHPALSRNTGEVIISYIASSGSLSQIISDSSLYRPRFFKVAFGLEPPETF